jgi:hypothetical protein
MPNLLFGKENLMFIHELGYINPLTSISRYTSFILPISIILDAVTSQFARNALFILDNLPILPWPRQIVHIVLSQTLALYIIRLIWHW